MIDKLGDAGSGRAAVEVQAVNFNHAVDAWRRASIERKGEFAAAVLSNLGEVGGTLEDRIGQADAAAIRANAKAYLNSS